MAAISFQQVILWLIGKSSLLPQFVAAWNAIGSATTLTGKLAAVQSLIDLFLTNAGDFPTATVAVSESDHLENLDALKAIGPINWAGLAAFLAQLWQILGPIIVKPTPTPAQ